MVISTLILYQGCKISYSFSGASLSPDVETVSVQYFQNRASIVQTGLSQFLTDELIDKCKAQTSLNVVNDLGDVEFLKREIVDYNTRPTDSGCGCSGSFEQIYYYCEGQIYKYSKSGI